MKKTIKVIDLYNKYVNNEEMPEKVNVNGLLYVYDCDIDDYYCGKIDKYLMDMKNTLNSLNDEVGIIEEEEKPKEITSIKSNQNKNKKINELIKAVNYLLKKEE